MFRGFTTKFRHYWDELTTMFGHLLWWSCMRYWLCPNIDIEEMQMCRKDIKLVWPYDLSSSSNAIVCFQFVKMLKTSSRDVWALCCSGREANSRRTVFESPCSSPKLPMYVGILLSNSTTDPYYSIRWWTTTTATATTSKQQQQQQPW